MAVESVKTGRSAAFFFIFVTVLLDMLAIGMIIPVLPRLIESLVGGVGISAASKASHIVGIFAASWAAMQFIFSPLLGALSDRFGRRPVILISNLGQGLDYIIMALAPSVAVLFIGRLLSGMASASIGTANAYIADVTPPEKRAQRFGLLGAAFGLGFTLGPVLGGVLGQTDLRLPFWTAAAMSFANFIYGYFILPESLPPGRRGDFSLTRANPFGALQLLASRRELWGLASVTFLSQLAHSSLPAIFVLYVSTRYGWDARQTGLYLGSVGIANMIVQGGLVRPVVKAVGERRAVLAGLVCGGLGLGWMGLAWRGDILWFAVPIAALWGLYGAASQAILTRLVGTQEQGRLQGAVSSVNALTGIIGPITFAAILGWSISPDSWFHLPGLGFGCAAAVLFLGAILASHILPKTA